MQSAGFHVRPFQATVPSFGIWGFALASPQPLGDTPSLDPSITGLRFLTDEAMRAMFELPGDIRRVDTEVNRLDNQILVRYYDEEWHDFD